MTEFGPVLHLSKPCLIGRQVFCGPSHQPPSLSPAATEPNSDRAQQQQSLAVTEPNSDRAQQ